jgi:RNA polymerase sigma factor (sigma-70 family)
LSRPSWLAIPEAVRDTFLIAASRLGRLRDPERLRPWLHAVTRNECLRRLGARQAASAPEAAADTAAGGVDITADPERTELRALVRSAVGGLNPGDRELIVLRLGLGMHAAEVANVLGVSRNRERLQRHIERCATCADRGGAELRRATLPGMMPAESLAVMTAENTWVAAAGVPAGLRAHVLWMATTTDDDALTYEADLRSRARGFGRGGFPKPLPVPKSGWYWSPQAKLAVVGGVAMVIFASWSPSR